MRRRKLVPPSTLNFLGDALGWLGVLTVQLLRQRSTSA